MINYRTISIFFFIFVAGGLLTLSYGPAFSDYDPNPCRKTLTYYIGSIDSRFNIEKEELIDIMQEVESLWESPVNKDLLSYNRKGEVAIHLIYGEDQQRTENERQLSERIKTNKNQIAVFEEEFQRITHKYKQEQKELREVLSSYNRTIENFNETIKKWNKKGGIPISKKDSIEEKQRKIRRLESEIKRMEDVVESLRRQANTKSRNLNRIIEEQNELVSAYNQKFGESRRFDQGQYIRRGNDKRINIYQFGNRTELKTVLAHEAGHALGLGHVDNPKSVMHQIMGAQNIFDLQLSKQDRSAIISRCSQ